MAFGFQQVKSPFEACWIHLKFKLKFDKETVNRRVVKSVLIMTSNIGTCPKRMERRTYETMLPRADKCRNH